MRRLSEILTDALESFEGGRRWTKDTLFRDTWGSSISIGWQEEPDSIAEAANQADTFCAIGAIARSMVKHGEVQEASTLVNQVHHPHWQIIAGAGCNAGNVAQRNDYAKSFEEVKVIFCEGIQRALAEEEKEDGETKA